MARPAADNIRVEWNGTGDGASITLEGAVNGFQAFPATLDGQYISYAIDHENGGERESGLGLYTHAGTLLGRDFVTFSTAGGTTRETFTAGVKHVRLTWLAQDGVEQRATVDPTVNDDLAAGYVAGRSRWLNTTTGALFFCTDHAAGAAVWKILADATKASWGLGSDAVIRLSSIAGHGLIGAAGAGFVWTSPFGGPNLIAELTGSSPDPTLPAPLASGAVRVAVNGTISNTQMSLAPTNLLTTDHVISVFDVDYDIASDASNNQFVGYKEHTNGFGFQFSKTQLGTYSAPTVSNGITLTYPFQRERFIMAASIDRSAQVAYFVRHGEVSGILRWSHTITVQPVDWKSQNVIPGLGCNSTGSGRLGTHDFYGHALITGVPAFSSAEIAYQRLEALVEWMRGQASNVNRLHTTENRTVTVTAAQVQAGYQVVRTGASMLHQLTEDLTAAATITLPANPRPGDKQQISRRSGGFFNLTETVTGQVLGYRDDYVIFERNNLNTAWVIVEPSRRRQGVRRRDNSGSPYTATLNESNTTQVFTDAVTYDVPDSVGTSTGFIVRLAQLNDPDIVTLTLGGALTHVSGPAQTDGAGTTLVVEAIGNSQIRTTLLRPILSNITDIGDNLELLNGVLSGTAAGGYVPMAAVTISDPATTDAPVSGTHRHYETTGAMTVTLGAACVDPGDIVLAKVPGAGTITVVPDTGAGFTLDSQSGPRVLHTTAYVRRRGTDFEIFGGTDEPTVSFATHDMAGNLMTVAGVAVASGVGVSGLLTMATHSGGIFTTGGNVTVPNVAGFSVTLIAGGAHTVGAGGATTALATGDVLSVFIPVAGTVRAVKQLAANVITMPTS